MRCASWLLMQEPIVTGCSQNVCWMYVGSRDRRVHRWSKNRGMIKLINKPTTCNYTTPPLCGIHFTTNVCNISGAMSITCIVSNCGWPLKVRIRAQWVVSECNTCSCPRVQAGLGKKMTKRIKKRLLWILFVTNYARHVLKGWKITSCPGSLCWSLQRKTTRCDLGIVVARIPPSQLTSRHH